MIFVKISQKCHRNVTIVAFFYLSNRNIIISIGGGEMWKEFNPNPTKKRTDDCAVRAVAKALGVDWKAAYAMITAEGYAMGDMPHANSVWGAVLHDNGFNRSAIPNTCPNCYTAEDFCKDHPKGVYVLGFGHHTAAVKDGILYDSWDSSFEVPQYYWYRQE